MAANCARLEATAAYSKPPEAPEASGAPPPAPLLAPPAPPAPPPSLRALSPRALEYDDAASRPRSKTRRNGGSSFALSTSGGRNRSRHGIIHPTPRHRPSSG